MYKLKNRVLKGKQYSGWHFVKQNYNFKTIKHFIETLIKYQKTNMSISFEKFNKSLVNDPTNKTLNNFRNVKTLVDLNLIENGLSPQRYKDYIIAKEILLANSDEELKKAIIYRMVQKSHILKAKSKKPSSQSIKIDDLEIPPYKTFFDVLVLLYDKTKQTYIEINEVGGIVTKIKDKNEIKDAVQLIISSRKKEFEIPKIKENRFHKTLSLLEGINLKGSKLFFDFKKINEYLGLETIEDYVFSPSDLSPENYIKVSNITQRNSNLQKIFKEELIKEFGHKCALCDINYIDMLRASHIKSVAHSFKDKKYDEFPDKNNGLLLCVFHDYLFDSHKITINDVGKVIGDLFSIPTTSIDILSFMNDKRKKYMEIHNAIYKKILK